MVKVIVEKVRETSKLPEKATLLSGGWDLFADKIEVLYDTNKVTVYTGLKMKPDPNYMIRLGPRSSITKTDWILQNSPGLGDPDYPGEYQLRFHYVGGLENITNETFPYKEGDRVAQMWIEEIIPIEFKEGVVDVTTDRIGGFGSTGK
jgi:dUTP pyrophosphatase